ncbi:hypothetical protein D3C87_1493920 [compost metagenome]
MFFFISGIISGLLDLDVEQVEFFLEIVLAVGTELYLVWFEQYILACKQTGADGKGVVLL